VESTEGQVREAVAVAYFRHIVTPVGAEELRWQRVAADLATQAATEASTDRSRAVWQNRAARRGRAAGDTCAHLLYAELLAANDLVWEIVRLTHPDPLEAARMAAKHLGKAAELCRGLHPHVDNRKGE
jgi:hypothetical protein